MIGTTLDGRYQIVRELGSGAMGKVFEAEHTGTGRRVAVKVILSEALRARPQVVARFQREARTAGTVDTQHIVGVLDTGVDEATELPFMVMELMKGEDAAELIRRVGPIEPSAAARIVAQACRGLKAAHEVGVIHRDIKPANLFLARRDDDEVVVKLLDFGIAKVNMEEAGRPDVGLTQTGMLIGSPLYMSPEQARGQRDVDARTDLWSLGVVFYQLLGGRTPFHHIDAMGELILAICGEPVPELRELAPWVPAEVAAVVHAALRQDPAARFQSADEMLAALEPLLPDGRGLVLADLRGRSEAAPAPRPAPVPTSPEARPPPPDPPPLREATEAGLARTGTEPVRRRAPLFAAVLAAAALAGGYGIYHRLGQATEPAPAPSDTATVPPASSAEVAVLADGFSGYGTLRQRELGDALAQLGVRLRYEDEPDQAARARRLGESADFMATSLDQVLLHRPRGRIVALIDVTAGADALVLNAPRHAELTSLGALHRWAASEAAAGRKPSIAYAAGTPSEYLALLLDARFSSFELAAFDVQEVAGATEAYRALADGAAAAVLWEPYVTRARAAGHHVALSSADVPEAMVDVLLASDRLLAERPEVVERVVGAYYRRMDAGFVQPSRRVEEIARDGKLGVEEARAVDGGLRFFSAPAARSWMDEGKLARRIEASAAILVLAGRLAELPGEPSALFVAGPTRAAAKTTESLIAAVQAEQPELAARLAGRAIAVSGAELDDATLAAAPVLGNLATLAFAPGSDALDGTATAALDRVVSAAADFNPGTTVLVLAPAGEEALAKRRGEQLRSYLRGKGLTHRIAIVRAPRPADDRVGVELVRAPR